MQQPAEMLVPEIPKRCRATRAFRSSLVVRPEPARCLFKRRPSSLEIGNTSLQIELCGGGGVQMGKADAGRVSRTRCAGASQYAGFRSCGTLWKGWHLAVVVANALI